MRKVKFAILLVLVLCLTVGLLVACNNTTGSNNAGAPVIPTNPDGSQTQDSYTTMSGRDAWTLFKDAASAANAPTGNYVYADSVIYLDYIKDISGYYYALKVQADIDLSNDANSELLLELWQVDDEGNLAKVLVGLYYYDSTLVYDCTGLKQGAKVVKTDDINITAIEKTLREMFNGSSLANFLLENLLTFDTGLIGTVEGLITALLGQSRLITNPDGSQRLEMPLSLTSIIGSLLSGVLVPGPDGLISDDIAGLIKDVLGVDLYMFEALVKENVSVYLIAELKDGTEGGKVLTGMSVDLGVDFNTYGTSLEDKYGIIESSVSLSVGASNIDKLTAPTLDVKGYLTAPKAAEGELESAGGRGIESVEDLSDYSLLTVDLTVSLNLLLNETKLSANQIIGAFGTLISGLIPEGSLNDLQAILDKEINIAGVDRTLNLHISGGIDMFDNSGTNLLVELTGEDVYNDVRASIAYVGADDSLYVDLSGILGTGKFVIEDLDVNSLLSGLIDDLVQTVKDALKGANLLPEEQAQIDDFNSAAEELLADGSVLQVYGASASGEPIADTMGLIKAILANIDVDMAGNIFNIQAITVTLTQEILDYIWSLAFTGDLEGATIPIVGGVELKYTNNGFATTKDIELGVNLGNVDTGKVIAGLNVGISAQFGSVVNEEYFNTKIASFSAEKKDGKYITLASFGDLFDDQGNFALSVDTLLAGIESVGIGLRADIDINAAEGGLADIYYEKANEFVVAVLAEFEQAFGAQATLVLQAEITDVAALVSMISGGGGFDIATLLPALNVYLALETSDGTAPLRVWLVDGVVYLATSEELLGGLALKVDVKPFLASAGGQSEALTSDETADTGAGDASGSGVLPAELLALVASMDITVGDLYIDVALGSGLLATLLNLIGVTGIEINASGTDETLGLDAGVSIELNDGLQIAGGDTSEGLSVGIVLGIGDNFDFSVDLGGVNAVVNGDGYVTAVDETVEFVDFFSQPYVNLSLELGLNALINAGSVSLGDGVGSIEFPEGLDVDLSLSLDANLDLGFLLADFTGVAPAGDNRTELALQLKNGEEVLLAVYYSAGTIYVDASTLIGARISTDLDVISLIAGLLAGSGENGGEAGTTAQFDAEDYSVGVFEFLMKVTSAGFSIEVAQGLTSVINDLIGMNLGEINAALALDWTNIVNDGNGGYLLDANVSVGDKASVEVKLSGLGIAIGENAIDTTVLPVGFDASAYKNIGSLLNDKNELDLAGLELGSVYAELSGTIDLSATPEGAEDWNVGEWINNFLAGSTTIDDAVKTLVQKLVLKFAIDRSVSTSLEFRLKAMLRFGDLSAADAVSYILSHSDIALEIKESGASENLLALYVIADAETGRSTLYISSDEGGLIGGGIAVPDIDLASLFASSEGEGGETAGGEGSGEAVTTADGDTAGTDSGATGTETDNILDTILGVINSIYMTNSELKVGFGANFIVSLLGMLLPGYELNAENFVQLNPENSFLSLYYGLGENEQREIGLDLSLGVDPFTVALGLGGLKVAVNDDSYAITPSLPDGYANTEDYYKNIFDTDGVVSLETTVGLELSFGDTSQLEDGRLPIGDMLSAIIGNLALELGLEIADDITLAVEAYIGANIWFGSPERTEIALEVRDAIGGEVIIAIYLRGSAMYVDMGMLSDNDFVVENTGIIATVTAKVGELLSGADGGTSASEALTASDAVAQADGDDMLDIVFDIADGHLALNVTEKVLLGVIGALVSTDIDINAIFQALNLGAEVSVDIDFEAPALSVNVDTNYASIGISINNPYITNSESATVTGRINDAIAGGNFQSYAASSVARFGLSLSVRYSADATYQEVDNPDAYANSDRYSQLPDGTFVQDNDGTFVRRGISLSDIIDALLDMPALSGALGNVGNETLQAIVNALVARLGIDLYVDDAISDNLEINIEGLLDLEALGLSGILTDFTLPTIDTLSVLNALQAGIEIVFNPEKGDAVDVGIYLQEGNVYVDLSGLGGPKISARLFEILAELGVSPFAPDATGTSEAVTAANGEEGSSVDVNALLNALVRTIVLRQGGFASAGEDGYYNMLQSGIGLDLMLPSNIVGNIVSMIVGNGKVYSFDDFILNEEQSGISLVIGGGNVAIEVAAKSDTGFNIAVSTEAGLLIDVATQDSTILSSRERSTYVDMTDLVFSIVDLVQGNVNAGESGFGSQRVTLSLSGMATFESDGEGSYDLGSLLAQYLGDIVLELNTEDAFSDGIAFRLSVAADLGAIDFASLTGDAPDFDAFLANTDLESIELALELLGIDDAGNIEQDNVIGGIYLYRGSLYLDGTGVFDVVENYSRVPNFLRFVIEAVKLSSTADDTVNAGGDATTQAVTAAEGAEEARDALIELIYSDTAMQIVITKSIISALLATLVPDLGSIADIFDNFEVTIGAEIGRHDYVSIYEAGLYKAATAADGAYVAVEKNGEIVGFVLASEGDAGDRYTLTAIGEGDGLEGVYYAQASDGSFFRADARYSYYEDVDYVVAGAGETGSFVKLEPQRSDSRDIYLESDRYVFYTYANGAYVMVTALDEVSGDNLYVLYDGQYRKLESDAETKALNTYVRLFGYVRDAQGQYYRVYTPHTAVSDFYLTLGANIGTINVGLALGGLTIDFGNTDSLIPDYILSGKSKQPAEYDASKGTAYTYDEATGTYTAVSNPQAGEAIYYYDVPILPFYDSVVTVGMSVEIELSITEGKIDVGQIFAGILGDLEGIVIEIPGTNKGYSSAHLRLDISLMLDMQNLPGSEIAVQLYNLSSEAGAEVLWLAAYYMDDMLYIDLSFFNMPKVAVPMTEISDWIEGDLLGDLLNTSIYDDVEVAGSSSEAITADENSGAEVYSDAKADLTTEEKVAALLISNRRLALSVGNAFLRYLLESITIGDAPLNNLVYEELLGGLDVTIDVSDGVEVALELALALQGDRYEVFEVANDVLGERYYVFEAESEQHQADAAGLFVLEDDQFRAATKQDTGDKYVRYEAVQGEDNAWTYYAYTEAEAGTYVYDAANANYVALDTIDATVDVDAVYGTARYTRNPVTLTGSPAVYKFVPGTSANPNDYDTELNLYIGINNLDLYFTEQREYSLTAEELAEYYNFNSVDTVSLSETISLELLFDVGSEIDLSGLFEYLFPDSTYDFDAIIEAVASDGVTDILRNLELTVSLEFKLGAFINYLRSLDATYPGGLIEGVTLPEEFDLVTFIQLIAGLVGKKDPANPADDLFGLEDFLNFVNASVVLSTSSNDGTPAHTMLGVYLSLGDEQGVEYDEKEHAGQQRYSHFFASALGNYGYVDGEYKLISEIAGGYDGVRYSRDDSYLYPDANGTLVRDTAGLYIDLSYLGQPGVYINLSELMEFVGGMMNTSESENQATTEAVTAADGDSSLFPVDLGEVLGIDVNLSDALPLLSNEIASYIQAFLYGIRITSTYIRVFLQADFIDSLLMLLVGDDSLAFGEFEQSYLGINVDVNNYLYVTLDKATHDQLASADVRFDITETESGMYYLTDEGYYELRSDMTEQQIADYSGKYYDIIPVETYLNVDGEYILTSEASRTDKLRAERYEKAFEDGNEEFIGTYVFYVFDAEKGYVELGANAAYYAVYPADEQKAFIEANIYLWNHSINLGINMPTTSGAEYQYENAGKGNGAYEAVELALYTPDYLIAGDGSDYLYYRGEYYQITKDALRVYENGVYKTVTDASWSAFINNPYTGEYYLLVTVDGEGFSADVLITESDVYEREVYKTVYRYVGEGNGTYNRLATTSLVNVPDFHVNFDSYTTEYTDSGEQYYVDATGNLVEVEGSAPEGATTYTKDEVFFVYDATARAFKTVASAKAAFFGANAATYDTDGDGVVDTDKQGEFELEFAVYLSENFYTDANGNVMFYDSEYISYSDTGELYYINVVIRGELSLGQYKTYLTAEEWEAAGYGTKPEQAYVLVRGHYVPFDAANTTHAGLVKYYAYTASSSAVSEVLGAILGDMSAMFTVADGYEAVLPFEIRATVKLDYANETDYDSLYVAGLELAIDIWRTEQTDGTLSHIIGLYYMSDVWNIGDNNIANDIINSAALYVDLSWLLGSDAKFKVDLSAYPLEDLLNDNIKLGEIFGGSGASEALTASDTKVNVGDASKASVLLNVFSRSIALKASAGLVKLLVSLIAPNNAATLEEILPNLSINAQIDAAPYDLTIGATLFDEEGNGLLDLGLTLNLFNTDEASDGLQLGFGSLEDYAALSAAQLDSLSKDYIFYYGLFTRDDSATEGYFVKDGTDKGYVKAEATEGEAKYVLNLEDGYDVFVSNAAKNSYPEDQRYAEIPAGYIMLETAEDYAWATGKGAQLYYYSYGLTSGRATMNAVAADQVGNMSNGIKFVDYGIEGQQVGFAKLYINYNLLGTDQSAALAQFGLSEAAVKSVRYGLDSNGAHKLTRVFNNYQDLLALDLGALLNKPEGEELDILGILIGGLQSAGLEKVELGATLALDLSFQDAIDWTRQMTRLLDLGDGADAYFQMMLASLAMNSAEFVSAIGLDIKLALQIRVDGLIEMLPELLAGGAIDTNKLLGALLGGASIYLEVAIDTNFFGDKIVGADPIRVWLFVDDELNADVYIDTADLGTVIGSANDTVGNFFGKLKLEGMLNIVDIISSVSRGDGTTEAVTAADGGIIIDIGDANTGIVPEDVWGILNLILSQVLFANDMISVGLAENLLAGLIEALVPEFEEGDLELLPTFKVTSGADTSGVNILFGGLPTVQVQLGLTGGFNDFATPEEAAEEIAKLIGADGNNTYNIDSISTYLDKLAKTSDGNVVISTEEYALAAYASPEEVWLGDRYTLSFENGEPVFTVVDNAYANAFTDDPDGIYGDVPQELTSYQGVTGGQVTEGSTVTYAQGSKMLVSRIETLMNQLPEYADSEYVYDGQRYTFDEDSVTGEYVKLGDVTIAIDLSNFGITLNKEFSSGLADSEKAEYRDVLESKIRLSTSIDVGFYGHTGANIDLGALADLLFGIEAIRNALGFDLTNNSLDVTVTGELGNEETPYFNVALDGYLDLATGGLQVKLIVGRYNENGTLDTVLAASLAEDTLYADLSGLLGSGVKGYIANLGVEELLKTKLGEALGTGTQKGEATTASIADTSDMTLHEYAYLGVMINPGYFSLQLTLTAIQAIIAKVGADNPDLKLGDIELPDLGDIMIESHGNAEDGPWLSLNAKLSENFGASIDIHRLYLGTEPIYAAGEAYNTFVVEEGYTKLYDIASGEINNELNISISASADISMTSEGLNPGDEGYDTSLAGWVIDLVTGLLGSTSIFVTPYDIGAEADYNAYGGPIYKATTDETGAAVYVEIGKVASDGSGYYALNEDGTYATGVTTWAAGGQSQYYRTTIVEATFAANEANITIDLEGDLNIGAIVAYGIGGILFSDFRISVGLGSPFNSTILEVYYLGSSRLSTAATNNIYTLVEDVNAGNLGAFNDAIYIDATGLGLGKIKLQGLAGIFGANIGQIYDNDALTASADTAAEGDTTGDATTEEGTQLPSASVSLGINIAENYIGIGIDRSLIQAVFSLLETKLGDKLGGITFPDIQSLDLGLNFGDTGISSIAIDAVLDPAGTGAHIALSDLEISLEPFVDVDSLVNQVATQFAGITYSKTAGTMTLLQSLIDGIDPNLSINIDRRSETMVQATSGQNGNTVHSVKINRKGSISIVSTFGYYSTGGDGMDALGGGTTLNDYAIRLDLAAVHPDSRTSGDSITAKIYFGNNNLMLEDLEIGLGGLQGLGDMLGIFNWIDVGSLIGGGQLFPSFAYNGADTSTWSTSVPVATTASDNALAYTSAEGEKIYGDSLLTNSDGSIVTDNDDLTQGSSFTSRGAAATNVNRPYKYVLGEDGVWASGYSYAADIGTLLNGLVEKVTVNLFNRNGYQPYLSTMPDYTNTGTEATDSSLISVKLELNKDAYNELLIFLYTTLLSLFQVSIDVNGNNRTSLTIDGVTGQTGAKDRNEYWYFPYYGAWNNSENGWMNASGEMIRRHENTSNSQWVISNLFAELDSIDYMNLSDHDKTVRRVQLLEPYVRALPVGLLMWLLLDMVALGNMGSNTSNYGALFNLTSLEFSLGDATIMIASLLPPFASYDTDAPNPSLNVYIDLAPDAAFYGFTDGREIAPGIQSIELMVNAEKYGGGKYLAGINDSGSRITGETLYYDGGSGALHDGYVLSLNPRNLVDGSTSYSGEGLFKLLEADYLNGNLTTTGGVDVDNVFIEVDDIGTRSATMYSGSYNSASDTWSGTSQIATGTLNADLLTANLPTSANVILVGQSSSNGHDVPLSWDASAVDLSAPTTGTSRLAGFVYGYALNLVVAKIPVYVTNTYTFTSIYGYNSDNSMSEISVDMTSGNPGLPDLAQISFNGGSFTFGTQYSDELGPAYAVRLVGGSYEMLNDTLAIYPAYNALMVYDGDTPRMHEGYYVIDSSKVPSMPVGTIAWDVSAFSYGWEGGEVTLGFTYQWGYSAEQYAEIEVPVTGVKVEDDDSLIFSGSNAPVYGSNGGFEFADWTTMQTSAGDLGNDWKAVLKAYIDSYNTLSGTYVVASGYGNSFSNKSIAWDLSAIDSLEVQPGSAFSVTVTMFVGVSGDGFNIWRQYDGDNPAYGLTADIGYLIASEEGAAPTWTVVSTATAHGLIREAIANNGYVTVAQPVSVTISVGAEAGFQPAGLTGTTEEGGTTDGGATDSPSNVNTFAFSDGSATNATADGVQTYEITTAAQLYGAMPESGVVVNGATGTTRAANFDWNGFVYDTKAASNVASLTVTSGSARTETDVVVTLADNADVNAGVEALESATAGYVTGIVDARYRAMVIDPFAYTTFGAWLAAKGFDAVGNIYVNTVDGQKSAKVVSWSSVFQADSAMPVAGARYDDNTMTVEIDGVQYSVTVPLVVLARDIIDTEIVLVGGFDLVNEYSRFSSVVRRYVSEDQVIEITYSRDNFLPTAITVYNLYAYQDNYPFTGEIAFTFADGGEVRTYNFNVERATPTTASETTTNNYTYTVTADGGTGDVFSASVDVTFNAVRITANNMDSDVAYGDLGGSDAGYVSFAPYAGMSMKIPAKEGEPDTVALPTVAETQSMAVGYDIMFYIDGSYVAISEYNEEDYKGYTVLSDDDVKRQYVRGSGTSYNRVDEGGTYYFVYAAVDTLSADELTWDHSGISYNYNGGLKRTSANVQHNGITGTITVPIWIVSGKIESLTKLHFNTAEEVGQSNALLSDAGNSLTVDPFDGIQLTELAKEGGTLYKYFPYAVDAVTADGSIIENLEVTWSNLASIRNTYRGGTFDARLTVPAGDITAQGFTAEGFVTVINRTAEDTGVDGRGLWAVTTTNGVASPFKTENYVLAKGYADQGAATSYIDPYEFDLSAFRTAAEAITEVSVYINGIEERVTFGVAGTDSAAAGYKLVWSFAGMAVNYLGGRVALIAQLTGPDGTMQEYEIDYLVTRKLVSRIEGTKGSSSYTSDINTTVGADLGKGSTYTIDPFTPSTQSLPTGWSVTFMTWTPNADGSFDGVQGVEQAPVSYSYITSIMPSSAAITAAVAQTGNANAGDATMQIAGGQRLRIPIAISGRTTSSNPTQNGNVLQSKVDGVTVVWYGTVEIRYNNGNNVARYNVTFADPTGANITVEAIEGRSATYNLTPYIGAVINAAGKVLDWNGDVPAGRAGTSVTFTVTV